jgi:hypothetical protein
MHTVLVEQAVATAAAAAASVAALFHMRLLQPTAVKLMHALLWLMLF